MSKHCWILALLTAGAAGGGAWAQMPPDATAQAAHVDYYRSNIGHTGVATEKLAAPLSLLWRHTTSAAQNDPASPVYANGTVYFASGGALYAVNAADGTTRWQYPQGRKSADVFRHDPRSVRRLSVCHR